MKSHLEKLRVQRELLSKEPLKHPSGLDWCRQMTALVDDAVRLSFKEAKPKAGRRPSVVATGSYGRNELSPFSDIDVVVFIDHENETSLEPFLHAFHRNLVLSVQDMLGLKLDYAIRSEAELPGLDPTSRTALIDSRLITGDLALFERFMNSFWASFPTGEFLADKRRERVESQRVTNETPLSAEPNLKEGAGGLRCNNTANWMRAAIGERLRPPSKDYETIISVRNTLQALANRSNDTLTRSKLGEIATVFEAPIEDFTHTIGMALWSQHRLYLKTLDHVLQSEFSLKPRVNAAGGKVNVQANARLGDAVVGVAIGSELGLSIQVVPLLRDSEIDAGEVLSTISAGESVIRQLDSCGLLHQFLPELVRCRTLIPPDASHVYTVFEHTIRAISEVERIGEEPFWREILASTARVDLLNLAILLHDVGKADPSGPHSERGAVLAEEVCRRWNLSEGDTATVCWLVLHHLSLARMVRIRDVYHTGTAEELAQLVATRQRLNLLTLLTLVDIAAVHPGAWTAMYDTHLADLYRLTSELLDLDSIPKSGEPVTRRRISRELRSDQDSAQEIEEFLATLPASYVEGSTVETVRAHLRYVREARQGEPVLDIEKKPGLSASELTVVWPDKPGILSTILGVLYAYDVNVHAVRASTTNGSNPIALDTIQISFSGRPLPEAIERRLIFDLRETLSERKELNELLKARDKDPYRLQRDYTFQFHPGKPDILEIHAPRGRGMAFRFSRIIAEEGWNIQSAKLGQWGGRGAISFYINGEGGQSISSEDVTRVLKPGV